MRTADARPERYGTLDNFNGDRRELVRSVLGARLNGGSQKAKGKRQKAKAERQRTTKGGCARKLTRPSFTYPAYPTYQTYPTNQNENCPPSLKKRCTNTFVGRCHWLLAAVE